MDFGDLIDGAIKILTYIVDSPAGVTITLIGFLLTIASLYLSFKAASSKPEDVPKWYKTMIFVTISFGVLFSVAGPALAIINVAPRQDVASSSEIFDSMRDNERVHWLARLITHHPEAEPHLSISKLTHLGKPSERFTFVADYEEIRGRTVEDAVKMIGGAVYGGQHVSVIIFPVEGGGPHQIFPANARGILQAISDIQSNYMGADPKRLDIQSELNDEEKLDLSKDRSSLRTWAWPNYSKHYGKYCRLSHRVRCNQKEYNALNYIGSINNDWHPLGLSRKNSSDDACTAGPEKFCEIKDIDLFKRDNLDEFGARIFLMNNMELSNLKGKYMFNSINPRYQRIPDIGPRNAIW